MTKLNPPIGLLGGTFDPIHYGHLRSALELKQALRLEQIHFIPCYQPVHRKEPEATPQQRFEMVKLAIANEVFFAINAIEMTQQRPSFTIQTIEALKIQYPHTPLCFILGIDALLSFPTWERHEDILKMAHLIVMHRPQYQIPTTGPIADFLQKYLITDKNKLFTQLAGGILPHPVTQLEISATELRKLIRQGLSPRFLLPDNVLTFIHHHQVYR